jgi:class 3 adenylate cyclase
LPRLLYVKTPAPDREPRLAALPTGTVTFLFTDIEGSTRLLQRLGDGYAAVRDAYAAILRRAIEVGGGGEVGTEGDSLFVAFRSPARAVEATVAAQRDLAAHDWPMEGPLRVRTGCIPARGSWAGRTTSAWTCSGRPESPRRATAGRS